MTSKEFVLWLKGFTEGVHEFNITPKQWDLLKDKLAEVKDETSIGFPFGVPNTAPIQTLPHITPSPTNPYRPYEVYCGDTNGTTSTPSMVVTTTPGTGFITIANPNIASFSGSYNPSTSTAYGYPSGSAWHYTTSNQQFSTQDDNSLKPIKQNKFKKRKAKSVKEWEDTHDLGGQD
jgi:hypothetical protein